MSQIIKKKKKKKVQSRRRMPSFFGRRPLRNGKIPTTERPLQNIVLTAPLKSSDPDSESETEQADFPLRKC